MKIPRDTLLVRALTAHRINPAVIRDVVNQVFGIHARDNLSRIRNERSFQRILDDVRITRRNLISNRSKWPKELVELYEEYISVLDQVMADVRSCMVMMVKDPLDPEGPRIPATPKRIAELAEKRNAAARAKGEPLGPACNALWVSWVEPATITRLIEAFDTAYTTINRGRGNRFMPFHTTSLKNVTKGMIERHRTFIRDQREAILAADKGSDKVYDRSSTLYGALHLCALRMAEITLDQYERDVRAKRLSMAANPIPVNWMHLLTPEMRKRVRDADTDPSSVTPEGLTSFLVPKGYEV